MSKACLVGDRIIYNTILVLSSIHYTSIVLLNWNRLYVIVHLDTNIFLFLLSIFLDLIFLFFFFFFIDDEGALSRSLTVDFILFFLFTLFFYFTLLFLFIFIFRTTWVRVYQSRCHISHKLMV